MPFNKAINRIKGFLSIDEASFLYELACKTVDQFGDSSVLCEIGSFCGKSTVSIGSALKERKKGVLYAIDWHQGSQSMPDFDTARYKSTYDEFISNLEIFSVRDYIRVIKNKSEESVHAVPKKIHFLWVDGEHGYDNVKADFENYSSKIAGGGFLLFHDACWTTWTEPFKVISESVLDHEDYNLYALIGNTMIFRKERNRTNKMIRDTLRRLCIFVSGENRGFHKRVISFILFRLTKLYTRVCHHWK